MIETNHPAPEFDGDENDPAFNGIGLRLDVAQPENLLKESTLKQISNWLARVSQEKMDPVLVKLVRGTEASLRLILAFQLAMLVEPISVAMATGLFTVELLAATHIARGVLSSEAGTTVRSTFIGPLLSRLFDFVSELAPKATK